MGLETLEAPSGASTPMPVRSLAVPEALHALHSDELSYLLKHRKEIRRKHRNYFLFALDTTKDFIGFLVSTWARTFWDVTMLPTVLLDRIVIVLCAIIASFIMYGALLWCLFCKLPFVDIVFDLWSRYVLHGASWANSVLPGLFDVLSDDEVMYACDALSEPISQSRDTDTKRDFNVDIAKLLLQCAAVMYERTSAPLEYALNVDTRFTNWNYFVKGGMDVSLGEELDPSIPGAQLSSGIGQGAAMTVNAALHKHPEEISIVKFAAKYGLKYSTLSEMNSQSSSSCGIFYHPDKTFIILAYKGTSPEEYSEWVTDLMYAPKHAGGWINGFDRVHGGFFSKVFPARLERKSKMPYTTIQHGISTLAEQLLRGKPPGTEINVWTTGHSLGCSLASLVYARQINEPADNMRSIVIRDAYLFAAPILCDITSVNAFDNRMRHHAQPRTMWRVSNGKDIVATGLPHMGDYPQWGISSSSAFSFAHLGAEIDLKPDVCLVRGTHVTPGSDVSIVSRYSRKPGTLSLDDEHRRAIARQALKDAQKIPLVGSLLAHTTVSYWVALTEVKAPSHAEWA